MGRSPCCSKEGLNRGAWTAMEDKILTDYIQIHGEGKWRNLPKKAGLKRCGKSCRLRWLNYLRPDIKRGNITSDEEELIIRLHKLLGNRWSLIAGRLPGRTDNEIKNYWNTNIGKKLSVQGKPIPIIPIIEQSKSHSIKTNTASSLVWTKPTNSCHIKPVISPQEPEKCDQPDNIQPVGLVETSVVHGAVEDRTVGPESVSGQFDFMMMDFEMDEKLLADFLDTEFSELSYFEKNEGDNSNSNATTICDQLNISDFQSMACLIDCELDWLSEIKQN